MRVQPPIRVTRRYVQALAGTPDEVMPLLCPVRETEWVPGWAPRLVLSESGHAERDCVFTTPDGEREATWIVTEHDVAAGVVEMLKVVPGYVATRLRIAVSAAPGGGSAAEVVYTYTALGAEGEAYVAGRTEEAYAAFMRSWETALNAHLERSRPGRRGGGAPGAPRSGQ